MPPPPLLDMTHITVPSVEALDLGAATRNLDARNLTVGTVTYQHSATVGKNLVASQDPAPGAIVHRTEKQGPPVNLVVSLGPAPSSTVCVVPKVQGKSLRTAKRRLTAAHCKTDTIKRAFSRTVPKGHVVAERPGSGRKLQYGARVALTVSKGRRR